MLPRVAHDPGALVGELERRAPALDEERERIALHR